MKETMFYKSASFRLAIAIGVLLCASVVAQTSQVLTEKTTNTELRTLCTQGNLDAMCLLGERLIAEKKTEAELQEGISWIKRAADSGHPFANYKMACLYDAGIGVQKDHAKVVEYIRICAAQGFGECQFCMGQWYELGDSASNTSLDIQQSIGWFRMAAKGGHFASMRELAFIYSASGQVERSLDTARKWLSIASLIGDPESAYQLACSFLYADTIIDSIKGYAFYSIATSDSTFADKEKLASWISQRDSIRSSLTPEQLVSAQKFIQNFLDKRKQLPKQ